MKRLLIAVALLALTAVLCFGPLWFLENSTDRLLRSLDEADAALQSGDLAATAEAVAAFCSDLERSNRYLPLFFPHEKMDAVEESAALLPLLVQQNSARLAEELARCRYRVQHLRQSERLSVSNIL